MKPIRLCYFLALATAYATTTATATATTKPPEVKAMMKCNGSVNGQPASGTITATIGAGAVEDDASAKQKQKEAADKALDLQHEREREVEREKEREREREMEREKERLDAKTKAPSQPPSSSFSSTSPSTTISAAHAIANGSVQEVTVSADKPVLVYLKATPGTGALVHSSNPCAESAMQMLNPGLIPSGATGPPIDGPSRPEPIPQHILPGAIGPALTSGDEEVLRSIDAQPSLLDLPLADRNAQVGRYVEFLEQLRRVRLHRVIKLPRMVLIGEEDTEKYDVIESYIGIPGVLRPLLPSERNGNGADVTIYAPIATPRFAGPVRFTLINDQAASGLTFSVALASAVGTSSSNSGAGSGSTTSASATSPSATSASATSATLSTSTSPLNPTKPLEKAGQLFEALTKAFHDAQVAPGRLTATPVEVIIRGPGIPSLVFIDLPRRSPSAGDSAAEQSNDAVRAELFRKYLAPAYAVIVAIGSAAKEFARWETLIQARTYDHSLQRTIVLATNPPPEGAANWRIEGLIAGLQQAAPKMHDPDALFFLLVPMAGGVAALEAREGTDLLHRPFCSAEYAGCGRARAVQALQLRLLRIWRALQAPARRLIEQREATLSKRLAGYHEFEGLSGAERWKALIASVAEALGQALVSPAGPRAELSPCYASPLARITATSPSLFAEPEALETPGYRVRRAPPRWAAQWAALFAAFRRALSELPTIPSTVALDDLMDAVRELRAAAPVKGLADELRRLLAAQLDSLQPPTSQLIEAAAQTAKGALDYSLGQAPRFAPFPAFAAFVRSQFASFVSEQLIHAKATLGILRELEEVGGWEVPESIGSELAASTFTPEAKDSAASNGSSAPSTPVSVSTSTSTSTSISTSKAPIPSHGPSTWSALLTAESDEAAVEALKQHASDGFSAIKHRQKFLCTRVMSSALLAERVPRLFHDRLEKAFLTTPENARLTQLSPQAHQRLLELKDRQAVFKELIRRTTE